MSSQTSAGDLPGLEAVREATERLWRRGGLVPKSYYVQVEGLPIHYVAAGEGEDVVLLHGAAGGAAKWYPTLAPLAQRFRVVAPDLPGFGLSAKPRRRGHPQEIAASFLEGFMEAAGLKRASLMGGSLGGFVALSFALRHPERVKRLVLMDALGLGQELPFPFHLLGVPLLGWALTLPSRCLTHSLYHRLMVHHPHRAPEEVEEVDYLYRVSASPGYRACFSYEAPMLVSLRGQRNGFSDDQLRSLSVPTLILWGEQDRFFPLSHARRAARLIPGAQLRLIPEAGHVANWDNPEAVNSALIEFLTKGG